MQKPIWLFITDFQRNTELGAVMKKDFEEVSRVCEALDLSENKRGREEGGEHE